MKNAPIVLTGAPLYQLLVDSVDEYAIFALDTAGKILTWNSGAQKLKGYSADEAIGSHFSRFCTEADTVRNHPAWELEQAALKGKYEEEGWRVRKDGTQFWANVVITALRDPNGRLTGFGKVTRDLSERRRTELALRESEERFRLLVSSVRDYAIFMLDPEGRVATWNQGAERNKGYLASEIIGKHFSTFYPQSDIAAGKPAFELKEAKRVGRFEDEGWRIRKDGTQFWANVIITPVLDGSGSLIGYSKVTRDLTERKKAEDSLLAANQTLEAKVASRTAELLEAKERAEAAVRTRDQFFSMASHELKTPLASLKLQAQLRKRNVRRGNLKDFSPENLEKLCSEDEKQIERLAFLVDNMLDIARLSTGKLELFFEPIDLNELVGDVAARLGPMLESSGNEVRIHAPKKIEGRWDRVRLEQILINLLSNAGKYAPGQPIDIQADSDGKRVRIAVHDYGNGIPKEDLERIFAPYARLKGGESASGLGLGLHISREIAEAHGGTLSAQSEIGKGTRFTLELPVNVEKEAAKR